MSPSNLPDSSGSGSVGEAKEHRLYLMITADDLRRLQAVIPSIRGRLGRTTLPLATAGYEVLLLGLAEAEAKVEAVAQ